MPNACNFSYLLGLVYLFYNVTFASSNCIENVVGFKAILLLFSIQLLVLPGFNCPLSSFLNLKSIGISLP